MAAHRRVERDTSRRHNARLIATQPVRLGITARPRRRPSLACPAQRSLQTHAGGRSCPVAKNSCAPTPSP